MRVFRLSDITPRGKRQDKSLPVELQPKATANIFSYCHALTKDIYGYLDEKDFAKACRLRPANTFASAGYSRQAYGNVIGSSGNN